MKASTAGKRIAAMAKQEAARGHQPRAKATTATAAAGREHRLGVRITSQANDTLAALLYARPGASVADIIEDALEALAKERRAELRDVPAGFAPKKGRPYARRG